MTHDFKAADNYLTHNKKPDTRFTEEDAYIFVNSYYHTILHALRIADALMGDPTEEMIDAAKAIGGIDCLKEQGLMLYNWAVYKAMRDKMLEGIKR